MRKVLEGKMKKVMLGLGTFVLVGTIGTGILFSKEEPIQTSALEPSKVQTKLPVEKKEAESRDEQQQKEKVKEDVVAAKENHQEGKNEEVKEGENVDKQEVNVDVQEDEKDVQKGEKVNDVINTEKETVKEAIPFLTVTQDDNSLETGKQVVAQEGVNGSKSITYEKTFINGQLTSKKEVSSQVTQQPINKIVKVGTKVSTPVPAPKPTNTASSTLSASGLFAQNANTFVHFIDNSIVLKVTISGDEVKSIYFEGNTYYGWNYVTEQLLINENGEAEGKMLYKGIQQDLRSIESAIRTAANAVYGKGTAKANTLYSEILKGGETQAGYTKNF